MCLENSHKYFLNFYVLGAFNIMYKHQDFFYDCHFLYTFLFFHQPHHFFRIPFTTQHGVFHNVNFSSPASQFLSPFLHDKSHKRVFETLTVSGRRQKKGKTRVGNQTVWLAMLVFCQMPTAVAAVSSFWIRNRT